MIIVCAAVGVLIAISVYLLMSPQLSRWFYGIVLFSSIINIIILLTGRIGKSFPPFVNHHTLADTANPVPQALVLTAIVIGFGLLAFVLVLLRNLLESGQGLTDTSQRRWDRIEKESE